MLTANCAGRRPAWLMLFVALTLHSIPAACLTRGEIRQALSAAVDAGWAQVPETPGLQVQIKAPGRGAWTFVRGLANVERNRPMRAGLQQPIGSVTKTMTGTLILQLVQEGKLSLDDKLARWYPEAKGSGEITVSMLLNMSSGLFDYENQDPTTDPYIKGKLLENPHYQFDIEEMIARGIYHDLNFAPGTNFSYTNTGTVLLGRIAEKVTGRTYEQLLKQRLWRPLGMTRTFLDMRGGLRPPHAQLYSPDVIDGQRVNVTDWGISWGWAAGAAASTLSDLHRWAKALGTGKGVLRPETQALRSQHCVAMGPNSLVEELKVKLTTTYCLGAAILWDSKGRAVAYFHDGETWGLNAMLAYFPLTGATFVALANSDDDAEDGVVATEAVLIKALLAAPELFGLAP